MNEPLRILLVEDDSTDAQLAVRTLRQCNLTDVKVVTDGRDAIDCILGSSNPDLQATLNLPDLILLDLKLPRMGGIQVLQWLRAEKRTMMLPVVVLTASQDDRQVVEVHRLGVMDYIVKPLEKRHVLKLQDQLKVADGR